MTILWNFPRRTARPVLLWIFGRNSESMYWYYYFNDYMLEYIIDRASREIPVNLLCSDSLKLLKKYDGENHTDLYHTLKVYLSLDQNVLQTSKELYVHREYGVLPSGPDSETDRSKSAGTPENV